MDAPGKKQSLLFYKYQYLFIIEKFGETDGCYDSYPDVIEGVPKLNEIDRLGLRVQTERSVRRLGLHRVKDAIQGGLSGEALLKFVEFLLSESKTRQDAIQKELDAVLLPHLNNLAWASRGKPKEFPSGPGWKEIVSEVKERNNGLAKK
jgi:hypothetical protein